VNLVLIEVAALVEATGAEVVAEGLEELEPEGPLLVLTPEEEADAEADSDADSVAEAGPEGPGEVEATELIEVGGLPIGTVADIDSDEATDPAGELRDWVAVTVTGTV